MMVLRPYQYYAAEAIIAQVSANNNNGYIWHTTGSGKTMTSFKCAQLIANSKDAESMMNAMQEQTSFWGKMKRGAKFLFNSEARKAMQVYNEKTEAMDKKSDEIAMAELALKDPKKSAELASKRLMRNIIRNASAKQDKPRSLSV